MSQIKKSILIISLFAIIIFGCLLYNYNTPEIKKIDDEVIIAYKGYSITTTAKLPNDIKVEKVRRYLEKVGAECEFIEIIDPLEKY